jgi:hypothetical protein
MGDCEAWRDFEKLGKGPALCQGYVGDGAARLANEVTVFGKVRTVAGGLALDIDLLGKTAFHKCLQAVVDGGEGDGRYALLGPEEHLGGRGMVALVKQDVVDLAPLRSETVAVVADRLLVAVWH